MSQPPEQHGPRSATSAQRSAWWVISGAVSGGLVGAGVAAAVAVLDPLASGGGLGFSLVPFGAAIGGFWGGVGGLVSGCLCAIATAGIEKWHTTRPGTYGGVAAIVTFALALAFTTLVAGTVIELQQFVLWVILPVTVSTVAAAFIGRWIWHRTHTPSPTGLPRRRRLVVLGAALLVMAGAGIAGAWITTDDIGVDRDEMQTTRSRLQALADAFDTIDLPGTSSGASHISGCGTDSGDLFQPTASRQWNVTPAHADTAAQELAGRLLALGWSAGAQGEDSPPADAALKPDRFGTYTLAYHHDTWDAEASIAPTFDSDAVYVVASIRGAAPCYWKAPQD